MEHRWGMRKPLGEEVRIYDNTGVLGRALAVDINLNGLGLECSLDLHEGQVVEIELPEGDFHMRCLVVHSGGNRCGLMFLSISED